MLRIGLGYDVHAFAEGRKLVLGGVEIEHERGLLGHSDADVLAHALADAILGALREGDIGRLFPDTDPAYAGADSLVSARAGGRAGARAGVSPARRGLRRGLRAPEALGPSGRDASQSCPRARAWTWSASASRRPPRSVSASRGAKRVSPPRPSSCSSVRSRQRGSDSLLVDWCRARLVGAGFDSHSLGRDDVSTHP